MTSPTTSGVALSPSSAVSRSSLLIGFELQIDGAVAAEAGNRDAGLRVERLHPVAGRDVDDAPIGAVGARPVGDAAAGAVANRVLAAPPFVLAVHPQHFAVVGVEGDDGAPHAGRRVQHAIDEQRRGRIQRVGARAEEVGLQPPGDLQLAEVVLRDLVGGRVAVARQVAAVGRPCRRWSLMPAPAPRSRRGGDAAGVVRTSGGRVRDDGRPRPLERDPGKLRPIGRQRRRPARHLRRAQQEREHRDRSAGDRLFGAAGGIVSMRSSSRRRSLPCQDSRNVPPASAGRARCRQVGTVTARALLEVDLLAGRRLFRRVDAGPGRPRLLRGERCARQQGEPGDHPPSLTHRSSSY